MSSTVIAEANVPGDYSGSPSVDQYVESVPSGTGSAPRPAKGSPGQAQTPPAKLHAALRAQAGDDADALAALVTAPELGAPANASERGRDAAGAAVGEPAGGSGATAELDPSGPSAAVAATTRDAGIASLLGGVLVMTLVGAFVAFRRQRASN